MRPFTTIEEGKFYVNRIGYIAGPMTRNSYPPDTWTDENGIRYSSNGKIGKSVAPMDGDLITEHIADPRDVALDDALGRYAQVAGRAQRTTPPPLPHERPAPIRAEPRPAGKLAMEIGRMVDPTHNISQAIERAQNAVGWMNAGQHEVAVQELLGSINALTATVLLMREAA